MLRRQHRTECSCGNTPPNEIFWCDRHQCRKNGKQWKQCATNQKAFQQWESGGGQTVQLQQHESPTALWSWHQIPLRPLTFAKALGKHLLDGLKKCTDKEIEARLAICQDCPHFQGNVCGKCGCPLSRERKFRNKLAWRSESCPVGKWPPLSEYRWQFWRVKKRRSRS